MDPQVLSNLRARVESLGVLSSHAVKPSKLKTYRRATLRFCDWLEENEHNGVFPRDVDMLMVEYVEALYEENPKRGSHQEGLNELSGVEFFDASLRHTLLRARQALAGWDRMVPGTSQPPLPSDVLAAFCAFHLDSGLPDVSLALALAHHGYLRAREVLSLRACDFAFPGDVRLSDRSRDTQAGCMVLEAKTGKHEFFL